MKNLQITKSELFKLAHKWAKDAAPYWLTMKINGISTYAELFTKALRQFYKVYKVA